MCWALCGSKEYSSDYKGKQFYPQEAYILVGKMHYKQTKR